MNKVNEVKKKAMMEALEKSLGVVTQACKISSVSRTQYYQWLKDDPEFKKQTDDIAEIAIDFAESKLHSLISQESVPCTIFYLKTKGKKRGYVETQELAISEPNKKPSWITAEDEAE
jgi:hypothetical protein